MATHSSILAWEMLWAEASGGLQSHLWWVAESDTTKHTLTLDYPVEESSSETGLRQPENIWK